MKKYFLIAVIIHSFLFIHISHKNTLGSADIPIKKNIPISYNIKNKDEKIGSVKTEKVSELEKKEERTEPLKKKIEEKKPVPQIESKMTKNKKTEKKNKEKQAEKEKSSSSKNNAPKKESNFIENADGTYTAVSSKGIDFKILNQVDPDYPRQAEIARYSKTVVVEAKFLVDFNGNVENIKIIKSHEKFGFDKEVISALKKWKFKPIIYNGRNIKVYFNKEFVFTPKK